MAEDEDRRSRAGKKKNAPPEPPEPRKGVPTTDEEGEKLANWIIRLWRNNESPEHIDVVQLWRNGGAFGAVVDSEPFATGTPLGHEQAVELANRFIGSAQDDCDKVVRRRLSYGIIAYSKLRGSKEYARYPLDLNPSRNYLTLRNGRFSGGDDDEEDDGAPLDAKTQSLKYLGHMIAAGQFDKQHYGQIFGDMFLLMKEQIHESRAFATELMTQNQEIVRLWMDAVRGREAAESTALDREMAREWNKMKMLLARDATRTGRNLLMSMFGGGDEDGPSEAGGGGDGEAPNGRRLAANGESTPRLSPKNKNGGGRRTEEQNFVDNFLFDCEEAGIAEKLFGAFKEVNGEVKLETPGIFTVQQFAVLAQVQKGLTGPEALDVLLPGSGTPFEITMKQVAEATEILPDGIALSLQQLFMLRTSKKQKAAAAANESPTPPTGGPNNP